MMQKKYLILFFASLGTALFTIDLAVIAVSLPKMIGSFSANKIEMAWIITVYSISTAVTIPCLGYLSKRVGRKNIYMIGIIGFCIFSICSALSFNLDQILFFRTMQGIFSAPLVALSQSIILDEFPKRERGKAMSWWTFGLLFGPVIGPILGGYLTEEYGWRLIFFINIPIGIPALIGSYLYIEEKRIDKKTSFSWLSFILLAFGAGSLQIILDRGQIEDWFDSNLILILTFVAFISILAFIILFILNYRTLFPRELFIDSNYLGGLVFVFLFGLILVPPFILIPEFLSTLGNYPVDQIGLLLTFSGIGGMIGSLIAGRIISLGFDKTLMVTGLLVYMFAAFQMVAWNSSVSSFEIIINGLLRGLGIGVFYVGLATATYASLPKNLRDHGASLFQFVRNFGSAFSVAIIGIILDRYKKINISELSARVNANQSNNNLDTWNLDGLDSDTMNFVNIITNESLMISMLNVFFLLAIFPILFFPFLLLFKKNKLED